MRTLASFLSAAGFVVIAIGCTTGVDVGQDGATTSTSSSSTTGSSGGSTSSSTTAATTSSSATTGVGGSGGGCSGAALTVDEDGVTKHFDFSCSDAWGGTDTSDAVGYIGYLSGHSTGPEQVFVVGCAAAGGTTAGDSVKIQASQAMVGTAPDGILTYRSGALSLGCDSADDSACAMTVTVTELSSDTIRGSFQMDGPDGSATAHHLKGTFKVCRVGDFLPP